MVTLLKPFPKGKDSEPQRRYLSPLILLDRSPDNLLVAPSCENQLSVTVAIEGFTPRGDWICVLRPERGSDTVVSLT